MKSLYIHLLAGAVGCALAVEFSADAAAKTKEIVLYSFTGGSDGGYPEAGLITDSAGNLYSSTLDGGADGWGTVFKLAPKGTESVLLAFDGGNGGAYPSAGLIADSAGNLYGTTANGGTEGYGTVFKLTPHGKETVLHSFAGGSDGQSPEAGLIADSAGDLYGTTSSGGGNGCAGGGCGTVFKVTPNKTESVLLAFNGGSNGSMPVAGLIMDKKGNLYGTTYAGGPENLGTVFKLAPNGTETVLLAFSGGSNGDYPEAGLIMDKKGNLYGTTASGGDTSCNNPSGCGAVFELAPDGTETVLYGFKGGTDGEGPFASVIADKKGNLYGTTISGGAEGHGTVFKVSPKGAETVLYSFTGGNDGGYPDASLIADKNGNLYSTTREGGAYGEGTVFKLTR